MGSCSLSVDWCAGLCQGATLATINMALLIKIFPLLFALTALTTGRPSSYRAKPSQSVVDLDSLSGDAKNRLDSVWDKQFNSFSGDDGAAYQSRISFFNSKNTERSQGDRNWYIFGHKQDEGSETAMNHAEASNGQGTKVGRYSYIDANGRKVVTHYKSTPGKGIHVMSNNLPEDTADVKQAKDQFFKEFEARKALYRANKEKEQAESRAAEAESGAAEAESGAAEAEETSAAVQVKPVAQKGPEDTPEVKKAKEIFFREFNARKELHRRNKEKELGGEEEEEGDEEEEDEEEEDEEDEEDDDDEEDEDEEEEEEDSEEDDDEEEEEEGDEEEEEDDDEEEEDEEDDDDEEDEEDSEEEDSSSSSSSSSSEEDSDEEEEDSEEDEEEEGDEEEDEEEEDEEDDDDEEDEEEGDSEEEDDDEEDDDEEEEEEDDDEEEEEEGEEEEEDVVARHSGDFGMRTTTETEDFAVSTTAAPTTPGSLVPARATARGIEALTTDQPTTSQPPTTTYSDAAAPEPAQRKPIPGLYQYSVNIASPTTDRPIAEQITTTFAPISATPGAPVPARATAQVLVAPTTSQPELLIKSETEPDDFAAFASTTPGAPVPARATARAILGQTTYQPTTNAPTTTSSPEIARNMINVPVPEPVQRKSISGLYQINYKNVGPKAPVKVLVGKSKVAEEDRNRILHKRKVIYARKLY